MWSERVCTQCQADLGHGPGPLCGPCTLTRHGTTLDPAQPASAASIPALRAVIAGVRTGSVVQRAKLAPTLADACERLAEENERMQAQLTAAEAAREEDFASFVASELFAQEVRENAMEYAAKCCEGRAMGNRNTTARHEAEKCAMAIRYHARNAHLVRALDLPTPTAALQRVREQDTTHALGWAWFMLADRAKPMPDRAEFVADGLRALLTPAPAADATREGCNDTPQPHGVADHSAGK